MNYQLMTAPGDEEEYLLFSFMVTVKDICYKGAVAESLNEKLAEQGIYDVLLQSPKANHHFQMTLDENAMWKADNKNIDEDLIYLIGNTIEEITG